MAIENKDGFIQFKEYINKLLDECIDDTATYSGNIKEERLDGKISDLRIVLTKKNNVEV